MSESAHKLIVMKNRGCGDKNGALWDMPSQRGEWGGAVGPRVMPPFVGEAGLWKKLGGYARTPRRQWGRYGACEICGKDMVVGGGKYNECGRCEQDMGLGERWVGMVTKE